MTKATASKASKRKAGQQLVSMKELEAMYATEAKEALLKEPVGTGVTVRTKGKKFKIGEETMKEPMMSIILGTSRINAFYEDDYDQDNPQPPICTAVAATEDEAKMVPSEASPKKQHPTCAGCPQSAWGSADKGRGKACKNVRRVALMGADDKSADPQVVLLNIPPTGLKKFSAFVKTVATAAKRPLYGIISAISFDPEQDWPVPVAEFSGLIDDPGLATRAMKAAKSETVKEMLYTPMDTTPRVAEAKPKVKPKAKRKF